MGFRRVGFRVGFLTNGLVTSFPKKRLAFADPEGADLMSILKAWPPSGCCWLTAVRDVWTPILNVHTCMLNAWICIYKNGGLVGNENGHHFPLNKTNNK